MDYLLKDECYKINGAAMKVYNTLKSGFLEAVYQEALEIEFKKNNIPYVKEALIDIYYDGIKLEKQYRADFICYDQIIIEIKALADLTDEHSSQLINYLTATKLKLGILINFGNKNRLQFHRVIK